LFSIRRCRTARVRCLKWSARADASAAASLKSVLSRATALFDLARENKSLDRVEADLTAVEAALAESPELRATIVSPVFSRDDLAAAVKAIAAQMELGPETSNTLGLLARNRRLFVLPSLISSVKAMMAAERGEVAARVTSAKPLSEAQTDALRAALKAGVGKDVDLDVVVDEGLIGGLVVKVGSRMIDSSIRSKLAKLQNVMKEVG
jgi:F-type H+-transporting ATPase subunit delta